MFAPRNYWLVWASIHTAQGNTPAAAYCLAKAAGKSEHEASGMRPMPWQK